MRLQNDRSFLKEGVKHLYTLVTLTKNDNLNREECILREMLIDIERDRFDDIDRLDKRDTLKIGLRQRWQFRDPAVDADGRTTYLDPRELFYLDLWGVVNLEPEDDEEALTEFDWDARYYPAKWMSLSAKGRYDLDAELIDRAEFVLSAWHDVFKCDVEYLFREDRDNLFSGFVTWLRPNTVTPSCCAIRCSPMEVLHTDSVRSFPSVSTSWT